MSTTDLFTDDFPHGTPAGFEQGCRGAACPNHVAGERTCKQAHLLYQSDYGYRRSVDAGVEWVEPVAVAPVPEPKVAKPAKVKTPKPAAAPKPAAPRGPNPAPKKGGPAPKEVVHGTDHGYRRGCKKDVDCPGDATTGKTCRTAQNEYLAEWRRKKKGTASATEQEPRETAVAREIAETIGETPEEEQTVADNAAIDAAAERFIVTFTPQDAGDAILATTNDTGTLAAELPTGDTEGHWIDDADWKAAVDAGESPLAPPAESLALAMVRTELADMKEQRQLALTALNTAKEENVQLHLALDVALDKARTTQAALAEVTANLALPEAAPTLTIDPTEAGGVTVVLAGVTGTATLALTFAEHGLQDVNVTVSA